MTYTIQNMWLDPSKYPLKSPRTMNPKGIIIHNTSNNASAMNEAKYMTTNNNNVSFHVVVDDKHAVQCVPFSRVAHHAGNYNANQMYVGLEIAQSSDDKIYPACEANAIVYVAHVCMQYGWNPHKDIRFHREFNNTACPVRIPTSRYKTFRDAVSNKIDEIKNGGVLNDPKPPKEKDDDIMLTETGRKEIRELLKKARAAGIIDAKYHTDDKIAKYNDVQLLSYQAAVINREFK